MAQLFKLRTRSCCIQNGENIGHAEWASLRNLFATRLVQANEKFMLNKSMA